MTGFDKTYIIDHAAEPPKAVLPVRSYTLTDPDLKTNLPYIWLAADKLRAYGHHHGQKMINHLEQSGIRLCEEGMGGIAGLFNTRAAYPNGDEGPLVSLNPEHRSNYERLLIHEVFHSYQHTRYQLLDLNPELKLRERVLHSLLLEAGAETLSATICYEMKMNGYAKPFENAKSTLNSHHDYARFYRIYEANVQDNGDGVVNLKYPATQVFNAYLRNTGLVSTYAQRVIASYLLDLQNGCFKAAPANGDTRAKARSFCGDLIDDIQLPQTDHDLFAGNNRLRQLAAWTEYKRWQRHQGESECVRAQRASLIRDENPFMGIKLADLCKKLRAAKGKHMAESPPVLEIACEIAGLKEMQSPSHSFNNKAAAFVVPHPPTIPQRRYS